MEDFIEVMFVVVYEVLKDIESLGIVFDGYGVGSFMIVVKIKGMIVVELLDECFVYMVWEYNNVWMIMVGVKIVGMELVKNIIKEFLIGYYVGGCY